MFNNNLEANNFIDNMTGISDADSAYKTSSNNNVNDMVDSKKICKILENRKIWLSLENIILLSQNIRFCKSEFFLNQFSNLLSQKNIYISIKIFY